MDFIETFKLVAVILAALVASRTIWSGLQARYRKGWGSRRVWRNKLNLMANGATSQYVEDLLGTPIFVNHKPPSIWAEDENKSKWVDLIFSTPHAWVVTRRVEEKLESWSVTITDPKFWWELGDVTLGQVKGKLGRATFGDLLEAPSGMYESSGARSGVYAESAYFGNPGAYQSFIFMHNEEGVGKFQPSGNNDVRVGDFTRPHDRAEYPASDNDTVRSETTVNTIIISWRQNDMARTPWQQWAVAASDQTRLLHRFRKKHGWQAKRSMGAGNSK